MKIPMISTRWCVLGVAILLFLTIIGARVAYANDTANYKSALLMDAETGQVLFEENAHQQVIPASVVKMMVLLLVMEHLDAGTIHLSDIVTVSAWASKIGGHQVYLAEGEQFTLEELLKTVAISSANDGATAVAEYLAGSADACVELMNLRAKELGMNDTTFINVHGLPPDNGQKDNRTSAYDVALLGRELLQHPKILEWSSTVEDTFRNGTFTLTNTNRELIRKYQGVDGLKTGYHSRGAGFNVCATAKRGDMRLIAVVLGAPQKNDRYSAAVNLFNRGFNQYERVVVLQKGFTVGEPLLVERGKYRTTTLVASKNVVVLVKKGQEQEITQEVDIPVDAIVAPVEPGVRFGETIVSIGGNEVMRVDLVTETYIEKGSVFDRMKWWIVNTIFPS